jgi:hypothetical protein
MRWPTITVLGILLLVTPGLIEISAAATLTVNPDGTGAYPDIESAITAAAPGDTVLLGDGVFTGDGNWELTFQGKPLTLRSASGDPALCIIDSHDDGTYRRALGLENITGTASVEGITFQNCVNNALGVTKGGVETENCQPSFTDCVFQGNSSFSGAGVYCKPGTNAKFARCEFIDNYVRSYGAGAFVVGSTASFTDCVFRDNGRNTNLGDGQGLFANGSTITLAKCTFENNQGHMSGALGMYQASATVSDCVFIENAGRDAGALNINSTLPIAFENCSFIDNYGEWGNVLYIHSNFNPAQTTFTNCNLAFGVGGPAVWVNIDHAEPVFHCCNIYGNEFGDWTLQIADQLGVNDNISTDPLLCREYGSSPYTLWNLSPCLPDNNPCGETIGAFGQGCFTDDPVVFPDGSGPFANIQTAVDWSPEGGTVLLEDGVFTGEGNREIDFRGKSLILTAKNGDPAACVIDLQGDVENHNRGFLFQSGEGAGTIISDLTITGGYQPVEGGAVLILDASPTFEGCVFTGNQAGQFGGTVPVRRFSL